ncbi:hypothetical protein [Sphingobacterium hungaricum]|uniref:Uncharacterized protein n=1 Tax=Sphingobacterium hungaricum TaxID=2082723 RepID=A0A928UU87_9SPHI|nr:hypothetical protein [Sphingobacterium hungaricum]MBE8713003.1 hypothetical protein [Sphingobacterium hungaricum]
MRITSFVFLVVLFFSACQNKKKAEEKTQESIALSETDKQDLMNVITRFARAYLSQDNGKANALIHPDLGLVVIYRPGAMDTFTKVDSLDFKNPIPAHYAYETFSNQYALTFGSLPKLDCGNLSWDKQGFFCDTTENATTLSTLSSFYKEINEPFPLEEGQITELEKDSYRVILVDQSDLIFHVKRYENNWYVTVLDRAYSGCDA